jgi:hypothetical protein
VTRNFLNNTSRQTIANYSRNDYIRINKNVHRPAR